MSFESSVCNYFEDVGIGIFDRVFSAVWYRFGKDGIFVKIKENKKLIIAADGWYDKSNFLICAYFASDGLTINVSVMSTQTFFSLYDNKNDNEEGVSVSVTVLSLDITSYYSLFLDML